MKKQEELHTERLRLRRIEAGDWESVQKIWEYAGASQYAQYDKPHSTDSEDVRRRIARWAEASAGTEHIFFAVCLDKDVIGYAAFNARAVGYELGYCFHSAWHGKGYARESLAALVPYMKGLGTKKLSAGTAINNVPSVRLLGSLGFELKAVEKVSFYKDENGGDIVFDGGVYELEL